MATPRSRASATQSSNSGWALVTACPRFATFMRTGPKAVVDGHELPGQALAQALAVSHADRGRLAEQRIGDRRALLGRDQHGDQRARPVLLHLDRHVEDLERAGRVQLLHQRAEQLRVHVVDLALDDDHLVHVRLVGIADQHAQHVRRLPEVVMPRAVADGADLHRRQRAERGRVRREQQRAGRRQQLGLRATGEDRRVTEQAHRGRRRHGEHTVRRVDHAAPDVDRRADDAVGLEPVEREDRADDVDDGVERADLVQVHALHRHLVNGRFRLCQPLEQGLCAVLPCRRQRGPVDVGEDFGQAAMRVRRVRPGAQVRRVLGCAVRLMCE